MSFSLKSFREIAEAEDLNKLNEIVNETNLCAKGKMSVSEEYAQAIAEMLEIINHTNKQTVKKLSAKLLTFFEKNASTEYTEKFDYKLEIKDNPITEKTKHLITMIYRNYLCTEKERDIFDEILRHNMDKPKETNSTVPLFKTESSEGIAEKKVASLIESEEYFEGTIDREVVSAISTVDGELEEDTESVEEQEVSEQEESQLNPDSKALINVRTQEYSLDEEMDEELEDDVEFNYYVNFRDTKLEEKLEELKNKRK